MITSKVTYLGNLRTEAVHSLSNAKIITDAPTDNNGKGQAFSPTDLVATSLASCMLTIIGIGAESRNININGTTVEVTKIMGSNPRKISEIILKFNFPNNNYTQSQKDFFKYVSETCPVAKSLNSDIKQTVIFEYQ